jgi:RNA polymerase sigma-70 factor (ECF subfamily)
MLISREQKQGTGQMEQQQASDVLESLVGSWRSFLVRYAFRLTKSRETAEDLSQEAFLALYVDLQHGKKINNVKAWTVVVVRNLAYRDHRDRHSRGEVLESTDTLDARSGPVIYEDDRWESVKELFSVLTPREAEVMMLRMRVLKYREIADQLKISHKSVATLLARGLRKMHIAFKEEFGDRSSTKRTRAMGHETSPSNGSSSVSPIRSQGFGKHQRGSAVRRERSGYVVGAIEPSVARTAGENRKWTDANL